MKLRSHYLEASDPQLHVRVSEVHLIVAGCKGITGSGSEAMAACIVVSGGEWWKFVLLTVLLTVRALDVRV